MTEESKSTGRPIVDWLLRGSKRLDPYRKRISFFVLIVGLLVIGTTVGGAYPRDVELVADLGAQHADYTSLRIIYLLEGEMVAGATFNEPRGLEQRLRHEVKLSPARYTVSFELGGESGQVIVERGLRVPAEGRVLFQLTDEQR